MFKLFDGHQFSNLSFLRIINFDIKTLKKKLLDQFPMIKNLFINYCNLEKIEDNALSRLKQLVYLDLSNNCIKDLDKKVFSELTNLQYLILNDNSLENIEKNMFSNRKNLLIYT